MSDSLDIDMLRKHGDNIRKVVAILYDEDCRLRDELNSLDIISKEYDSMQKIIKDFEKLKSSIINTLIDF